MLSNFVIFAVTTKLSVHFTSIEHTFDFFFVGFTACQDYFGHFELSQSLGEAKTGDP